MEAPPRNHRGLDLGSLPYCQAKTSVGQTPLHYAAIHGQDLAIRLLRERGADVEAKDEQGRTLLYRAAYEENAQCIRALLDPTLKAPANPNTVDSNGTPAIMVCVGYSSSIAAAKNLLAASTIDADARNTIDQTLLHLAARDGRTELIEFLLENNHVDAAIKDHRGRTAVDVATDPIIIQKIVAYSRNLNPNAEEYYAQQLLAAVPSGHIDTTQSLLTDHITATTAITDYGENVLHVAVKEGKLDIVKILLDKEHHIIYRPRFLDITMVVKYTALHLACMLPNDSILKYLLTLNTSPFAKTMHGDTVLHVAVESHKANIVRTLLGTDKVGGVPVSWSKLIEETNNECHTALWIAFSNQ